ALHPRGELSDAQVEASQALGAYIQDLETEIAPRARASFRLGRDKVAQKVRLDEGVPLRGARLRGRATRELKTTQEALKSLAGRHDSGDPMAAWAKTKQDHPAPGQLVSVGRSQLDELKEV